MGYYSDIPDVNYYCLKLQDGKPILNKIGMPLIKCFRGTSNMEAMHRQLKATFRNWKIGPILLQCLHSKFAHRYNLQMLERKIASFPQLGMYDTWLIDLLQNLVRNNHGVVYCQSWMNASEIRSKEEKQGIVQLHSLDLGKTINEKAEHLDWMANVKRVKQEDHFNNMLTLEQRFICKEPV